MIARLQPRWPRLLIALLALAAAGPALADLLLFQHDNYEGRSFATTRSVRNLADEGFNDRASSVVIRGGRWQLCSDAEFGGHCVTLGPGRYPSLGPAGLNDRVSSLRELGGPGGFGGDRDERPRVIVGGNGFGRVVFDDGCIVFYDAAGRRTQARPECNRRQVRSADEAMADHRRQQTPMPPPRPRPPDNRGDDGSLPQIVMGRHEQGEAIFSNNCVVLLSAQGRRIRNNAQCTLRQLQSAEQAMAAYHRERTMNP